jgi:Cathepsin propeptide inhibitor domain (I29)
MFLLKVLALSLLAAAATAATLQDFEDWVAFKEQFKKAYPRANEQRRFEIFVKTKQKIEAHNKRYDEGLETYAMGINSYSDLEPAEFKKLFTRPIVQ